MKAGNIQKLIPIVITLILLVGCHDSNSGTTSDDDSSTPAGSSDWGEMTWDQDNWA